MARYLVEASYTTEGVRGLLKEGGSGRKAAVTQFVEDAGGHLESIYFAFGESDVYIVVELPGNVDAAAIALGVAASGAVTTKTTVLLTPEEVDAASKKSVNYRPPGA